MGVSATGEENFGQRNDRNTRGASGDKVNDLTGPGRQHPRAPIDLLQSDRSGASEDKFVIGPPEGIIGGILGEGAAVISLRTEVTGCGESIQGEVLAFCTFQRTVAFIPDEGKTRTANASGQRKQTEFGG